MKKYFLWWMMLLLFTAAGCSRSHHAGVEARHEETITGSSDDPAVEFKTQWRPDERYSFYFRRVQTIAGSKTDLGGGKHKKGWSDQESIFAEDYSLMTTNDPSDSQVQLNYQIQSLEVDVAYGDQYDFVFDSENRAVPPGTDSLSTALRRLIGGELAIDLTPDHTVKKISGRKSLVKTVFDNLDSSRAGGYVDRVLSDETIKHLCEFVFLPGKAVRIGDSWKAKTEITTGYTTAKVEATCTFKGWQQHERRKCARFELDGVMAMNDTSSKMSVSDGHMAGRVWFDAELGMTAGMEIEQTATTIYKQRKTGETITLPVTQSLSLMLVEAIPGEKKAEVVN